jgi:hypothetical protein
MPIAGQMSHTRANPLRSRVDFATTCQGPAVPLIKPCAAEPSRSTMKGKRFSVEQIVAVLKQATWRTDAPT